jgi:acetoin utilization protein AcuB
MAEARARRTRTASRTRVAVKPGERTTRVEYWMKMPPLTVKMRDSVAHARALLEEHRFNQLPVVVNGKLVGIVSDRDLRDATAAVRTSSKIPGGKPAFEATPEQIPVEAVMSTNVLMVKPADSIQKAAELMRRERIGGVPVVDRGHLVGIITRSDVLDAFVTLSKERR